MSDVSTLRFVAVAAMLGVTAAWLLGIWLHVRLSRRARTAGARRIVRCVIPVQAPLISQRLVYELSNNPFFAASITGKLESVLTAVVTPITGSMRAAPPAARVGCRLDDLGAQSRLRLRIDFTPLLERYSRASQRWVFLFWPIWAFFTTAGTVLWISLAAEPSPWREMWLALAGLPLAGEIAIVRRCDGGCRSLGDAVMGVVEDLRTSLLV
jgi:hypothetical protein